MINFSAPLNKISHPSFKGYSGYTVVDIGGKDCTVNNYTGFMRDFPTLAFTKDYITKNFPKGTDIAEFGCSLGQKTYSLLMILDKYNYDKKYKISGYDFPEVIEKANQKEYTLERYSRYEQVLFPDYHENNIYDYKDVSNTQAKELQQAFKKYFLPLNAQKNSYTPNEKVCEGKIDFKPGDIKNIDKVLQKGQTGAVIFQNALYHILSGKLGYFPKDMRNISDAYEIFKKINNILPENGIFVIGNLPSDHMYDIDYEKYARLKYQDGKIIRVFDSSPVHASLRKAGFEPIFYEKSPDKTTYGRDGEVYLPSVWKKL